jgi:DNA invertase Pin-like site-specific DNA recombinase
MHFRDGAHAFRGQDKTVTDLNARRIGLRSLTENIDTTTPGGRLIFHVFGALAAFERDLVLWRG